MSRLLARLRYYAADAVDEWRHSPGVNVLATATLTAVLFVAALLVLLLGNLESHLEVWRRDLRVNLYLTDDIGAERRNVLRHDLEALDGVARVEYVDKAEALRRFRTWFSDLADVPDELDSNPLPASLEAYLDLGVDAGSVARSISERWADTPGVEGVRFDTAWLDRVDGLLALVRGGGLGLGTVVLAAVVLVIAGVLRLAVYARRDEIEIMLLVGATPRFVQGPFLVAGLVQGLVAAGVALAMVEAIRRLALASSPGGAVVVALVADRPLPGAATAGLLLTGAAVGMLGSWLAVRRDVRRWLVAAS